MTDVPWSKLRNCVFLGKFSKWDLNFQNCSKALCLGVSKPTKRLAAQSTAYALRNRQGKQAFVKENEKKDENEKKSKSVKSLRYMDDFFLTKDFSLLESCYLYIITKYKASSCCKIEAVIQKGSVKNGFLKILQNSKKSPCARVSFLIKLQLKKRLWHRCFPVNIAKFLRTPIFIEHLR